MLGCGGPAERGKIDAVRVIARSTLNGYVLRHVPEREQRLLQGHLDIWHKAVLNAEWRTSADLKREFSAASVISSERVVFNIKGNDYRLVVAINYAAQIVMIKWLGTHKEYDKINVAEVTFEKSRYTSSSD